MACRFRLGKRNVPLCGAIFALLFSVPGRAEEAASSAPSSVLSVDGGGLFFANQANLDFEQALGSVASFFIAPAILLSPLPASSYPSPLDGMWGGALSLGFRFFVIGSAPRGLFLGPLGTVGWAHRSGNGQETSGFLLSGGAMLGFNLAVAEHLQISAGLGAAYRRDELITGANRTITQGVVPLARLSIGVGF